MDLFDHNLEKNLQQDAPLADRMRPQTLAEFFGQKKIIGEGRLLRQAIEMDEIPSIIFWGPPGSGKTTLARIIANLTKSIFVPVSAVSCGVKDLRQIVEQARNARKFNNQRTIVFVDEIHRWNKAQQDSLLPYIEQGIIVLIGATTENPSFEVNSAVLSRTRVFVLEAIEIDDVKKIILQALANNNRGLANKNVEIDEESLNYLATMANGDARIALNALEFAVKSTVMKNNKTQLKQELIKEALQKINLIYDKAGEEHYNLISALHKSMRGSDVDASLYWLGRILEAGENPLYVARRIIRFASEDIGMADPQAMVQAISAYQASHFVGMPECNVNLAQAVVYCAKAQKSNALYIAYGKVKKDVEETLNEPVPLHLRNAPTELMKNLDYGKDYKYNPNFKKLVKQEYLPEKLKGRKYFEN